MARRRGTLILVIFLVGVQGALAQGVTLVKAFPNLTFTKPVFLTNSNDGTNRIFVVQQNGLIRGFPNDSNAATASIFLNIANKINSSGGEEGLLGLAFHPNYAGNRYFYVNYTAPNILPYASKTVIAREIRIKLIRSVSSRFLKSINLMTITMEE